MRDEPPSGKFPVTPILAWSGGLRVLGSGHSCRVDWFPFPFLLQALAAGLRGCNLLGKEAPVGQEQFSTPGDSWGSCESLEPTFIAAWGGRWSVHRPEERPGRAPPAPLCARLDVGWRTR